MIRVMGFSDRFLRALPGTLPGVVIFVVFPALYYVSNHAALSDVRLVGYGCTVAFLLWVFICYWLAGFSGRLSTALLGAAFFFGVYLLLTNVVSPLSVEPIARGDEFVIIEEPRSEVLLQLVAGVCVLLAGWFTTWNRPARLIASGVVVALLSGNLLSLARVWLHDFGTSDSVSRAEATSAGNVYHFIFDEQGPELESLARELGVFEEFAGFTQFTDTLTNSVYTNLSIPSIMSGTLPEPARIEKWKRRWQTKEGIPGVFQAAGYRVSDYQCFRRGYGNADYAVRKKDLVLDGRRVDREDAVFVDHVLLRLVPTFLRQDLFVDGRGWLARRTSPPAGTDLSWIRNDLEAAAPKSVVMVERLIREEAARSATGQYVFAHVMLPHMPYRIDRNLQRPKKKTSYYEQSLAAVRLMVDVLRELKRLGRYDSSTIIIHGDHGQWKGAKSLPVELFKDPATLLMIKRPGDSGPMRESGFAAQLLDIAPTLYALAGLDVEIENGGVDLFGPLPGAARDVHILNYQDVHQRLKDGFQHVLVEDGVRWIETKVLEKERYGIIPKGEVTVRVRPEG